MGSTPSSTISPISERVSKPRGLEGETGRDVERATRLGGGDRKRRKGSRETRREAVAQAFAERLERIRAERSSIGSSCSNGAEDIAEEAGDSSNETSV